MPSNFSDDGTWGGEGACYRTDDKKSQPIWLATSPQDGRMPNSADFLKKLKMRKAQHLFP